MSEEKIVAMPEGIDFNLPILDINNQPVEVGTEKEILTLGNVCAGALLATLPDDKADGTQKLKRFNLARKIQGSAQDDAFAVCRLNSKQKTMVLEMVGKTYATLIYGRVHEALEGTTEEDDE